MSDHLTTAEKGRLQVIFSDKTTLTLGPSSTIVIDKYVYQADKSAGAFVATATKGFFRMITGNISRLFPDRVKVKTPAATIGIRGCLLAWSVDAGGHPLELLYLGGLQGRERGIYAENGGGMSDLFNPEHGIRVSSPGAPPSMSTRWSAEAMMALLGPTVLHLPPVVHPLHPQVKQDWYWMPTSMLPTISTLKLTLILIARWSVPAVWKLINSKDLMMTTRQAWEMILHRDTID